MRFPRATRLVILVRGNRKQAEQIRGEVACLLRDKLKMELSAEKTLVTHVDQGFDFLGRHIRRVPWGGRNVGWTYPNKASLKTVKRKIKELTTRRTTNWSLKILLMKLNPVLRGWANFFRHDASKRTLTYVDSFAWNRVFRWLRKKHPKRTWKHIRQKYCGGKWTIQDGNLELFRPSKVKVERYRYRGSRILLPWMADDEFGKVGRFARSGLNEPQYLDHLQLSLFPR